MDMEATVMELIINAGESRSLAMQALQAARKGVWQDAADAAKRAHDVQTMLIGMDEGCGKVPVNLILVHAQDHIMTSMLARELIAELIEVQRQLQHRN
ncbi:PTS lactose/cellobiose transporter subunit IIA [Klebsiella pneumoniae]|uniref:PTS lactose/cellobiose transporter subunit IIA n=1 Tax=Klebsiella pneumoniae TaxID=573 RepID=UPI001F17CC10|nr:PTS lactose/cellobiose transporter subunit IIA [Klebsiella pneumoniae]MCE7490735.1 PTS lactose/cellobiose transporter subunit IIA [Klebsiella pneumoniae]MCE7501402.1 PTS lactose/cellobiose transporter subunit IIA [Klebsiella pneumoniae]MCQ8638223.1 PTS lactose/cellobiose transporter subunit IIA [Klebsiella pneumoniae]